MNTQTLGRISLMVALASASRSLTAQTLHTPGGTVGNISGSNVGIGTTTPDAKLDVSGALLLNSSNGACNHYRNVSAAFLGGGGATGTLKITLPKYGSNTMLTVTIRGYDYSSYGAWTVTIGGYTYGGDHNWYNYSAKIDGRAPFKTVRLANNGVNDLILLGNVSTFWTYAHVEVTDVLAGYSGIAGWGNNWSMGLITSETGISNIFTPAIDTFTDASGNVGIGTTSPGRVNSLLQVQTDQNSTTRVLVANDNSGAASAAEFVVNAYGNSWTMGMGSTANNSNAFYIGKDVSTGTPAAKYLAITTSGNVGLGTTNPPYKLVVSNNGAAGLEFDPAGVQLAGGVGIQAYNRATSAYVPIQIYGSKVIMDGGNVGIGTTNPGSYKLAVEGAIRARSVVVDNATWPDYVFKPGYQLASLSEVEGAIQRDGHLPGIPSAAQVEAGGVSLGDIQAKLLAKIEELTLHVIAQNKRLDDQAARIATLEQENLQLHTR